jgi:hypothetical protein
LRSRFGGDWSPTSQYLNQNIRNNIIQRMNLMGFISSRRHARTKA